MSAQHPEALRLADTFDHPLPPEWSDMQAAAAELRRLHSVNQELLEALATCRANFRRYEEETLKMAQAEDEELASLQTQRNELLESTKRLQGWIAVLLHTIGAEMDDFEVEVSNSKTGASVTINLKEHFDEASAAIAKAGGAA